MHMSYLPQGKLGLYELLTTETIRKWTDYLIRASTSGICVVELKMKFLYNGGNKFFQSYTP